MGAVYSSLLWEIFNPPPGVNSLSGPVPAGVVWVLRDIIVWNELLPPQPLQGFKLTDNAGCGILACPPNDMVGGRTYHFDVRTVLEPGDELILRPLDSAFSLRVSGYVLTLP